MDPDILTLSGHSGFTRNPMVHHHFPDSSMAIFRKTPKKTYCWRCSTIYALFVGSIPILSLFQQGLSTVDLACIQSISTIPGWLSTIYILYIIYNILYIIYIYIYIYIYYCPPYSKHVLDPWVDYMTLHSALETSIYFWTKCRHYCKAPSWL